MVKMGAVVGTPSVTFRTTTPWAATEVVKLTTQDTISKLQNHGRLETHELTTLPREAPDIRSTNVAAEKPMSDRLMLRDRALFCQLINTTAR